MKIILAILTFVLNIVCAELPGVVELKHIKSCWRERERYIYIERERERETDREIE